MSDSSTVTRPDSNGCDRGIEDSTLTNQQGDGGNMSLEHASLSTSVTGANASMNSVSVLAIQIGKQTKKAPLKQASTLQ